MTVAVAAAYVPSDALVAVTVQVSLDVVPALAVLPDTVQLPAVMAYVTAPVPLPPLVLSVELVVVALSVVGEALTVNVDCVNNAALTVKLKVAVAVRLLASVTVTVYVVALDVAVGVPVIAPVLDAMDKPAGNAGEIV